jgi:GNAT superfamily N-acetyltransferase
MGLIAKPLDATSWADFAQLAEDHRGVWSGCWCLGFHEEGKNGVHSPAQRRELKEARVREDRAHAALVYDGSRCVGWCQFGSPDELPRIKFLKAYRASPGARPDWRITCFFVGRTHRGRGVADVALAGALAEIGRLGGGRVESYPEDTAGRKVSGSFLNNATLALFERHGFTRERPLGKHHWVVSRVIGVAHG